MSANGSPYQPHREAFFALKYIRLMAKSGAAERMGGMAFALCCIVAAYQDLKRFKAPATFFNNVIMGMLGLSKLDTFIRARNRAIAEGWLGYESAGGSRMPGKYWVTIPAGIEEMSDVAGDDGYAPDSAAVTVPENRESSHPENRESCESTVPENRESNGIRESERLPKNGSASGVEWGAFHPIPIPIAIPSSSYCSEPASQDSVPQADASPSVLEFPTVGKGPKSWHLTAAKLGEYVEAFPGIDVPYECRRALQWCRDNPTKQKTANGMSRFLNQWMTREQNKSSVGTASRNGHISNRRGMNLSCQNFEEPNA